MRSRIRVLAGVAIVLSVAAGHALGQARSPGQPESAPAPAAASPPAEARRPGALPVEPAGPARQPGVTASWNPLSQPAQVPPGLEPRVYHTRPQPLVPTLLIPSAGLEPTQLAEIHEDMQIMSRILDKALLSGGPGGYAYPGANVDPTSDAPFSLPGYASAAATFRALLAGPAKCMEAIYLEGFGAIFVTRVDFPLAAVKTGEAPPGKVEESYWEQTKRELHGIERASEAMRATGYDQYYASGSRAQEYDAERVSQLQRTLLQALWHASNIRHLKPEDSVAVAVLGSEVKGPMWTGYVLIPQTAEARRVTAFSSSAIATRPTALTIRVKKSDIDTFARDELSFDELRKKATILAY